MNLIKEQRTPSGWAFEFSNGKKWLRIGVGTPDRERALAVAMDTRRRG